MPAAPIAPGAEMLVPVEPAAERRLRVVQVHHHEPVDAEPAVDVVHEGIDPVGRVDRVAGAPQVGGVEAQADPLRRRSMAGRRLEHGRELLHGRPDSASAAGRVLQDEHRRVRPVGRVGERPSDTLAQAVHAGIEPGQLVRARVDVHEAGAETGRDPHLLGEHRDRLLVEVVLGAGQVDQVGGMDRDRADVELGDALAELRQLGQGLRAAPP